MQLRANGLSKRQSLIQAGYSINTANQAKRVFKTEGMVSLIENFQGQLLDAGLTSEYWVEKIKGWSRSENTRDQKDAFDRWYKIFGESLKSNDGGQLKRKISFEEWIRSD